MTYYAQVKQIMQAKESKVPVSVLEDIPLIKDETTTLSINHNQYKTLTPGKVLHDQVIKTILRIKLPKG